MNENKKVFFIINKYSGGGYREDVEGRIITTCGKLNLECSIEFTTERGHATDLGKEALRQRFDSVFAVGGDGTVNEVAQALIHSGTPMGILPKGSGNGLAGHLGIPMSFEKSLEIIASKKTITMDTLLVNNQVSVNVSGIGFDGHVAGLFGKDGKRGLAGYARLVLREFLSYQEFKVAITIDDKPLERNAFIIALANSCQFGNNARVAPHASVCDQLLDVCLIRKVPMMHTPAFAYKMFTGNFDKSAFVEIRKATKVTLEFSDPMAFHIDGESMKPVTRFAVGVQPASLRMIVPERSKTRY